MTPFVLIVAGLGLIAILACFAVAASLSAPPTSDALALGPPGAVLIRY